jgi:hypothetical protein
MGFSWVLRKTGASRFGDVAVLAFLVTQALDGVLTYLGVLHFGAAIEGNPLIGALINELGAVPALAGAKLFAASLGIALHLHDVHRLVAALTCVYVSAAVLPWTALLWAVWL